MLHRLLYSGHLPPGYGAWAPGPHPSGEPPPEVLCAALADTHDVVFFTDHHAVGVAGIFPKAGGDAAFFGFWEAADDVGANQAAFAALRAEARARGFGRVQGPLHFSTYFRYRLRLGEAAPSWGQFAREPVNPTYYPDLLTACGFAPALTFESRRLPARAVPTVYRLRAAALTALPSLAFDFIPLTAESWAAHEAEIFRLVQAAFGQNPAYQAPSLELFRLPYNPTYAAGLCPHSSSLARCRRTGRLAAFGLAQPHYGPLGLPPDQPPVFARDFPRLAAPTLLAKTVGVHPDFRGRGLQTYLVAHAMRSFLKHYHDVIFCLMRSGNLSLRLSDGLPCEVARYALFEGEG